MQINEFFSSVEKAMLAKFESAELIAHAGDRGQNREQILRQFLETHLPKRFGVTKGEVITRDGEHSHAADIIIYDANNCPVLYAGDTAVLPIEGVYGVIEVKSTLTKKEFTDAAKQIRAFKNLAPRELSIIQTREYTTLHRPSRPFGIILGFQLGNNSLDSPTQNYIDFNREVHFVNYFTNMVVALGSGVIHHERIDFSKGEKHLLLDTDQFVSLWELADKRRRNSEPGADEFWVRVVNEASGPQTVGRFFVYLLIMLERIKLGNPDLGRYVDPSLPMAIHRES